MKKQIYQEAIHKELVEQVKRLIEIEIGNYAYLRALELCYDIYPSGGLDVYIKDPEFEENGRFEDICHIVHLHYEDMIYAILHIKDLEKRARDIMDDYLKIRMKK